MTDEIVPEYPTRSRRGRSVQSPHSQPSADINLLSGHGNETQDSGRLPQEGEVQAEQEADQLNEHDEDWATHSRLNPRSPKAVSQLASASLNKLITKKRVYKYVKRVCHPRKLSKMRTDWLTILQKTDDQLGKLSCCSTYKCFSVLNISFLREKMVQHLSASLADRKRTLYSMATSDGEFVFDGRPVCGQFLRRAFRFSLEAQANARRIPSSIANGLPDNVVSSLYSISTERSSTSSQKHSSDSRANGANSLSMDSILTFLDRLVDETAERMPDNGELHLPFFRKEEVYDVFKCEYKRLYPTREVPCQSYFLSSWKKCKFKVKVRQDTRFTKCSTCERLRSALSTAIRKSLPTDEIRKEKTGHNEFIAMERREYLRKAELAMLRPSKYLSVVIDGADQSAYSLPHFVTKVKDVRGQGLKVHLIGVLQHLSMNRLRLFTMTEDHQTGANHIVECVHRFVNDVAREGPLPRTLFLQLDNCVRENKNQYLLSYLDALIQWSVFDCIEVGFLPIGHTHCDVDQAFSSTSQRLRYHDAVTLSDLQHEVSLCYNEKTTVSSLKQVANWSGLCDQTRCNNNINLITQYRYFRFTQCKENSKNGCVSSVCHVRSSCTEDWRALEADNRAGTTSILKFLPDLSRTPPEIIECPTGEEEFNTRLDSERGRIVSEVKMRSLMALKKDVFRKKSLPFHWNLSSIVENGFSTESDCMDAMVVEGQCPETQASSSAEYSYDPGSFVAVNTGINGQGQGFWIGQIVDVHRGKGRKVISLSVNWYEFYGTTNVYIGRYRPQFRMKPGSSKKDTAWIDQISTETILVSFPKLTSDKRIPAAVSTYLREHFISKNGNR